MHIDRDIEPSRPARGRDAGRDRDTARYGHRRSYDAKHPRRDFSERVDGVVRDVAAFRVVAFSLGLMNRLSSSNGIPRQSRGL